MHQKESLDIINDLKFCVIDLETTGGNHNKDKIIEVGMVKIEKLKLVSEKSFLINPKIQIPEFIQKLTNISQKDVADSPIIEDVIDEILEFIGEDIIVAHNTSFDVPFLNGILKNLKREELSNKVICTNVMTKHLIPEILNSNLNYMSRLFNVTHSKAHRAQDDAVATADLLITYLNIFIEKGIKKVNQLYYPKNKFELDRVHFNSTETELSYVINTINKLKTPVTITVKGKRGLILAVIPLSEPRDEYSFAHEVISKLEWEIITVKFAKPFIDGLFQFNNHYLKFDSGIRSQILNYLIEKYKTLTQPTKIEDIDFVIGHHLIREQVVVYSFLNLNTNSKSIFKIPAQKKKLYQYLNNQVNRFEQNQKGRKKHFLNQDVIPLIENYLQSSKEKNSFLYLERRFIKNEKELSIKTIEDFVRANRDINFFPMEHL